MATMDEATGDPRPRKRLRYSPRVVQYQYPRQDPGDLTDSAISGLTSIIDEGTSILLPSDTATASDGPATRTRTRTRTRNSSQDGTSDGVSSTVDGGSSTTGAVSDSGGVTGTASSPAETSRDVQTLTGVANSMSGHQPTDHQQATGNAVPSTLSPSSTSAYTSVLITTTATVNGHLTTFATLVPTTLSSFPQDSSPSLKPPAVAAAVVGTLIATALLAGLGYLFVRRRKQRKMQTAMKAARKESMRRGRRVLDDDDGDDDEDGLPMRYAGSGSAGSHSHSMSTSYQYGVVGSLPPPSPTRGDSLPSSSSFSYNRSQDTFSFSRLSNNEFAGKDPAEVRRLRAGRTGSSSGSIFREDFSSEPLGGARLITTNASTPRLGSMASSPSSPSHDGTRTPTSNPFDGGAVGYFPHKRSSTASSSALGLLEAIGGVTPSASLEVVNMSRTSSPSPTHEATQLPYHQPKRSSVSSIRTHSLPSPKSTLPFAASATTTTTAVATPSRSPPMTSPPSAFQYPPSGRSPPATFNPATSPPTTTNPRSPQHFPVSASSTSPRSSLQSSYNPRNSLPPASLPPGAASPPGPLARTSIIVDEQFGVSASNYGLPATDHHYILPTNRRRSSSGATSISQAMRASPQPNFDPSDMVHARERQRRDSFVLPDIPVSGTGSLREKDRGSKVDLVRYLSDDEDGGVKGGVGSGGNERRPRGSFST